MGEAKTIAIIGGGASGLAAAVAAGEALRDSEGAAAGTGATAGRGGHGGPGRRVRGLRPRGTLDSGHGQRTLQLLERAARRGRLPQRRFCQARAFRVRMPGASSRAVPGKDEHRLSRTACWGSSLTTGLCGARKGEGRLYPLANKAASVLDCLRAACAAAGVEERVECEVAAVEPPRAEGSPFTLRLADGRFERAGAVIVAVGGAIARGASARGCSLPRAGADAGAARHRAALAAPPRQHPRARGARAVASRQPRDGRSGAESTAASRWAPTKASVSCPARWAR